MLLSLLNIDKMLQWYSRGANVTINNAPEMLSMLTYEVERRCRVMLSPELFYCFFTLLIAHMDIYVKGCAGGGGGKLKNKNKNWNLWNQKKSKKSILLASNTRGLIITKQTKPRPDQSFLHLNEDLKEMKKSRFVIIGNLYSLDPTLILEYSIWPKPPTPSQILLVIF